MSTKRAGFVQRQRLALGFLSVMSPAIAMAHGSVSMEQDVCKLKIGSYLMHFAGYQPERTRSEFCEDIPNVGRTVVVLDFVDDPLRDMAVQVQILKRPEDSSGAETVVYDIPEKRYPNGSIAVDYSFSEPGDFVGVIKADDGRSISEARFPFSVGKRRFWWHMLAGAMILVSGALGAFFLADKHKTKIDMQSETGAGVC